MAEYRFTPHQRFAIFTVHGERCYICRTPLNLQAAEIDHVIPESLLAHSTRLAEVRLLLGRAPEFDVNSPENWLPACRRCNGLKRDRIWDPSLLVQLCLQSAAEKAPKVEELIERQVRERDLARALSILERAGAEGELDEEAQTHVRALLTVQRPYREESMQNAPVRVAPHFEVIAEDGGIRLIKGRFGVGGRPAMSDPHPSFNCPNCGELAAWNGARCVVCGTMSDE